MADYKITKVQLELYKSIRSLEIHHIQFYIKQWHTKHDQELEKLAKKIRAFHEKYVFPLEFTSIKHPKRQYWHKDPEMWQLYDRPDAPPKALVLAHIKDQERYSALVKSQKKIEGPYLSQIRMLKKLDAINGSLKSQRVI